MKVFPCIPTGEQSKAPFINNGFKAASADSEQIRSWWKTWPNALIGVAIPDDLMVLDIDPRNGGSMEALEAVTGPLPDTLTSWSGRGDGGRHLWFKHADISSRQLPKGVDLKAGGKGYVIVPPSLHPVTGKPYTWSGGNIADLPAQAVEALSPPAQPKVTLPEVMQNTRNLNGIVRTVAEAVEGERNQKLYWAACRVFDNGDDAVIQDLFDAALGVGLTESEASATIDSARRTDRQQPEPFVPREPLTPIPNGTPEPLARDANASPAQKSDAEQSSHDPLGSAFTATSLLAQTFPPLEYVVPGVITEGLGLLVAPPKIGKSWMVLDVGIACSKGGKAFNAIDVDQRPVLYLALEDGPRRLQDRLRTLGMTDDGDDLTFMTVVPAGAMLTIGTFIERNAERNPLVILDTLGKARDVYTGNDAYQKDYKELSDYKRLVDRHPGASLLIVHHTNKGAHGDFVSTVSGTQGITGAADSVLTIERGRGEDEAVLNVTSRDAAEGSYAMTFDNGRWTLDGADLTAAAQTVMTRKSIDGVGADMTTLVKEVGKHSEGIRSKDLATLLGWKEDKTRTYMSRAYDAGRIRRIRHGLYGPHNAVTPVTSVIYSELEQTSATQITDVTQLQPGGIEQA